MGAVVMFLYIVIAGPIFLFAAKHFAAEESKFVVDSGENPSRKWLTMFVGFLVTAAVTALVAMQAPGSKGFQDIRPLIWVVISILGIPSCIAAVGFWVGRAFRSSDSEKSRLMNRVSMGAIGVLAIMPAIFAVFMALGVAYMVIQSFFPFKLGEL